MSVDLSRAIPGDGPIDNVSAPCVFCGEPTKHENFGGDAFVAGIKMDGQVYFFYWHTHVCTTEVERYVWTCHFCDGAQNLGDHCHECDQHRDSPHVKENDSGIDDGMTAHRRY